MTKIDNFSDGWILVINVAVWLMFLRNIDIVLKMYNVFVKECSPE